MTIVLNGTTGITSPAETVGSTITYADTGILATYASSSTSYNQVILQNSNSGTASSTDVIVSNDQGTASTYYGDFGMNSSGWTGSLPFSAANVVYLTSTSGPLSLGSVTSNPVYIATNSTTAVTIDTSQNVGIGTSSPDAASRITSVATATQIGFASYNAGTAGYPAFGFVGQVTSNGGRGAGMYLPADGTLAWSTAGSERMRIDSSGNLLVGTTSRVNTASKQANWVAASGIALETNSTTTANYYPAIFYNNTATAGYISVTGTTTSFASISDYRLKENAQPMQGALATVAQLKPCTYTWKSDGSAGQGFIAHELQAVVPDCVTGQKDAVDAEGNPVYQGVDTSFLVATLTAAIQELNATITDLQAKLKSAGVAGF